MLIRRNEAALLDLMTLGDGEAIVDLFAGGGGASEAIFQATGRHPDVAVNHDEAAVQVHAVNHPQTSHYCQSVWQVKPEDVLPDRPIGLLWLSPDCRHFSRASGGRPKWKSVRSLPGVGITWATRRRPRIIVLENVPEFVTWGPLLEDGTPCPKRVGRTFRWFAAAGLVLGLSEEEIWAGYPGSEDIAGVGPTALEPAPLDEVDSAGEVSALAALEDLFAAMFGRGPGDEPDICADHDRLAELGADPGARLTAFGRLPLGPRPLSSEPCGGVLTARPARLRNRTVGHALNGCRQPCRRLPAHDPVPPWARNTLDMPLAARPASTSPARYAIAVSRRVRLQFLSSPGGTQGSAPREGVPL